MKLASPAALVLALASPAWAATQLVYDAPAGCPGQAQFVDGVVAHGGDLGGGPAGVERAFVVSIARQGEGFNGTFQVREPSGSSGKRQVGGRSCSEVADALAMVTAIASRPEQAEAGPVAQVVQPAQPVPAPLETAATVPPPALPDGLRGHTTFAPSRTETVRVPAGELRFDLIRTASFGLGATWGLVPSTVLPRYDLTLTMGNFVTLPDGRQRIGGLIYQWNVALLDPGIYRSPNTTTNVAAAVFGVSVCQSPLYDSKGLSLLLCVGYGGGVMVLSSSEADTGVNSTKTLGFGLLSGSIDLQYNLSAHVLLSARGGGGFETGDIIARRSDGTQIFKSSPWSGSLVGSIGFRY